MDAQSDRQIAIYSPPFYSSTSGYKMRAKLYLDGDNNARRTHMSLFFVLMRGPNDAILKFPFNYTVTFCLFNQISQQQHIIRFFSTRCHIHQLPKTTIRNEYRRWYSKILSFSHDSTRRKPVCSR